MTTDAMEEKLRTLLSEISKRDVSALGVDDDLVESLGLDSLAGLRVLAAVEKQFDVTFPDDQLSKLRTLRQLLAGISGGAS